MFETVYELSLSIGENPAREDDSSIGENPGPENPGPENPLIISKKDFSKKEEVKKSLNKKDSKESQKETSEIIEEGFSVMHNVAYDPEYEKNPALVSKIREFMEFRKAKKNPMLPESFPAWLKKLTKLSGGRSEVAIEIIEESIANGWTGIFSLKE